jgi:hypothetical protein
MAEIVKETVVTQGNTVTPTVVKPVKILASSSQTVERLVYYIFGALEILLVFRMVLKITGANIYSAFVGLIYGITGIFILPFEGIFQRGYSQGTITTSIFEPATLVAIIVYVILAWGIVKLLRVLSGEQQPEN